MTGGTRNKGEIDGEGKTDGEGETDGEGKTDGKGETDGKGKRDGEGERDGQPPEGQSRRDILSRRGRGQDTRGRDAVARGMRGMQRDLEEFEESNTKNQLWDRSQPWECLQNPRHSHATWLVQLSVFFFSFSPRPPSIAKASLISNVSQRGHSRPRPCLGTLGM